MAELLKGERKGCPVEGGGEIPAFTMGDSPAGSLTRWRADAMPPAYRRLLRQAWKRAFNGTW